MRPRPAAREPRDASIVLLYAMAVDRHSRRREARRRRHFEDQRDGAPRRSRSWRGGFFPDMRNMPRRGWTRTARPNRGGYQFPPLWGPDSYNNGAGMSRLLTAAAYAMHNMPIGTAYDAPVLTDVEAYDVAAYLISHKRPEKANLDKDFPVQLQKPVDTPYGPYADGFSLEQHKFGPFGPIRAKVQELAAASQTAKAGEPDNGSDESDRAR